MSNKSTNIRVGADTSGIATAVQEITGSLRSLTSEIRNINKEAQVATEPIKKTFNNIKDSSGLAGAAVMGMTGIIQDANYGIRGVANNIQFVVPLLGQLVVTTGGVTAAFRALWTVMAGPMGLILAISTMLTLMERNEMQQQKAASAAKKNAEKHKEVASVYGEESGKARVLFARLTDLIKSNGDIYKIKSKVKKLNETYNLQLDAEKLTVSQLAKAYEEVNNQILTKMQITANEELLKEEINAAAVSQKKLNGLMKIQNSLAAELQQIEQRNDQNYERDKALNLAKQAELSKSIMAYSANKMGHEKNIGTLLTNNLNLASKINDVSDNEKGDKYNFQEIYMQRIKTTRGIEEVRTSMENYGKTLKKLNENPQFANPFGKMREGIIKVKNDLSAMQDQLNTMIESFAKDTLVGFLGSLGEELGGNTKAFDEWGKNFIASFGGFLQQMGAMIITYGVAMEAFQKAFTNPIAAIAAGAALIVIGGAVKGLHNKKFGGSSGGNVPVSGYTGSSGGSYGRGGDIEIYSRIDGRDIIMSSNRTSYAVRR